MKKLDGAAKAFERDSTDVSAWNRRRLCDRWNRSPSGEFVASINWGEHESPLFVPADGDINVNGDATSMVNQNYSKMFTINTSFNTEWLCEN